MGYVKDCEKCKGSYDVNMFYFCPYCYAGDEVKEINQQLSAAQKTIAEKEQKIKELDDALTVGGKAWKATADLQENKITKLEKQLKEANEVIEFYADGCIVDFESDDTEQLDLSKPWRHYEGKRARTYLAKLNKEVNGG